MTLLGVLGVHLPGDKSWNVKNQFRSAGLQKCHVILGGFWYPGKTHSIYVPDWIAREFKVEIFGATLLSR